MAVFQGPVAKRIVFILFYGTRASMFEFNSDKSAANLAKHGIDFEQAQALWDDEERFEVPAGEGSEERWLMIGMIRDRYWTAVYTMRDEAIRLISVRRSRLNEVKGYGSSKDN
jgi:uncharacterized protein